MTAPRKDVITIQQKPGTQGFQRWRGVYTEGDPTSMPGDCLRSAEDVRFDGPNLKGLPTPLPFLTTVGAGVGLFQHRVETPLQLLAVYADDEVRPVCGGVASVNEHPFYVFDHETMTEKYVLRYKPAPISSLDNRMCIELKPVDMRPGLRPKGKVVRYGDWLYYGSHRNLVKIPAPITTQDAPQVRIAWGSGETFTTENAEFVRSVEVHRGYVYFIHRYNDGASKTAVYRLESTGIATSVYDAAGEGINLISYRDFLVMTTNSGLQVMDTAGVWSNVGAIAFYDDPEGVYYGLNNYAEVRDLLYLAKQDDGTIYTFNGAALALVHTVPIDGTNEPRIAALVRDTPYSLLYIWGDYDSGTATKVEDTTIGRYDTLTAVWVDDKLALSSTALADYAAHPTAACMYRGRLYIATKFWSVFVSPCEDLFNTTGWDMLGFDSLNLGLEGFNYLAVI